MWAVAISYILLLNSWPLQDLKDAMFPDHASQMTEGYLTSVLLAWINARCVSFCLDRIWGRVEPEQVEPLINGHFNTPIIVQIDVHCRGNWRTLTAKP